MRFIDEKFVIHLKTSNKFESGHFLKFINGKFIIHSEISNRAFE